MRLQFLLFSLFFASIIAKAQYFEQQYPRNGVHHYKAIDKVPSTSKLFLGGTKGIFKVSQNGGLTWETVLSPTTNTITSIDFVSESLGFLSTNTGEIFKSVDAGNSFRKVHSTGFEITSLKFFDELTGYVVGHSGKVSKTTDGGETWQLLTTSVKGMLYDVWVHHKDTVMAIGAKGLIINTTDGGLTWDSLPSTTNGLLRSVHFPERNTGYIVGGGDRAAIYKTTNGGKTWFAHTGNITLQTNYMFTSVFFKSATEGFMVNANAGFRIYHTINGGTTWSEPAYITNYPTEEIAFFDGSLGFVIGGENTIMRSTDGGQSWIYNDKEMIFNGSTLSHSFPDANTGYVVGQSGLILKTTNGGKNWFFLKDTLTRNYFHAIHFFTATNGVAGDAWGNLFKTADGGNTWSKTATGVHSVATIYNFDFDSEGTGIAVGWNVIMKTTDFGNTWRSIPLQNNGYIIKDVYILSPDYYVAYAQHIQCGVSEMCSSVLASTDKGETWKVISQSSSWGGNMEFTSPKVGYISRGGGFISKTIDGGVTWSSINLNNYWSVNDISFINDTVGFTDYSGGIMKTTDGGKTWVSIPKSGLSVNRLHFTDENTGYLISYSSIWKTGMVGNVVINKNMNTSICLGQSVTLQAENGKVKKWYTADDTTSLGVNQSITVNPKVSQLYFVMSDNGKDSISINVDPDAVKSNCIPSNYSDFGVGINNFSLNTLNYIKTSDQYVFHKYTDLSCDKFTWLYKDSLYPISIVNTGSTNQHVKVWLDVDDNGSFTDSEMIFESLSKTNHSGNLAIPFDAVENKKLRLRIAAVNSYYSYVSPCPDYRLSGEFIDFSVKLHPLVITNTAAADAMNSISLYPSPATSKIILEAKGLNERAGKVTILSSTGVTVLEKSVSLARDWKEEIAIDELTSGIYFVRIIDEKGTNKILRFVKE